MPLTLVSKSSKYLVEFSLQLRAKNSSLFMIGKLKFSLEESMSLQLQKTFTGAKMVNKLC
jgi:hypothetical protein